MGAWTQSSVRRQAWLLRTVSADVLPWLYAVCSVYNLTPAQSSTVIEVFAVLSRL